MNTLQFRGLCLCFIYFCLRSCSLQNFLPFLDARMLHWALWFSPCHKPPWHPGGDSHSHHRLEIPIFKYQTCWDRTGHQFSHCMKHMEQRNTYTGCISGGADTGSEAPNRRETEGTLTPTPVQIHPTTLCSKATVPFFEFVFFTHLQIPCFLFHVKHVGYTQLGQVYSRSKPG